MLFVVTREIEGLKIQSAVFSELDDATECFEDAAYVVRNAPGEESADDPAIVTAAALYKVETKNPDAANAMVADGLAILLKTES